MPDTHAAALHSPPALAIPPFSNDTACARVEAMHALAELIDTTHGRDVMHDLLLAAECMRERADSGRVDVLTLSYASAAVERLLVAVRAVGDAV